TPTAGPNRRPDCQFASTPGKAREQQIRDVHATDEEHDTDSRQHQVETSFRTSNNPVFKWEHLGSQIRANRLWHFSGEILLNGIELRGCLPDRDTCFQTANRHKVEIAGIPQFLWTEPERFPDLWPVLDDRDRVQVTQPWKMKAGGQHAHDLVRNAINGNGTTDHLWIGGIAASPQLTGDHNDAIPPWHIVIREKDAP